MQKPSVLVVLLFALVPMSGVEAATSVYKCGTTYSQFPCPDGEHIKTDDIRSGAQKAQSDRAIASDKKISASMARNRLKQEKLDIAANTPPVTARTNQSAPKETAAKGKPSKPDWFIAQVPGTKKKPKTEKQSL